jgi:dTMP kinase
MDTNDVTAETTQNHLKTAGFQKKGLFFVFEGGEGSGKSTQAELLSDALNTFGVPNTLTREPGDSELGKKLREILLSRNDAPFSKKAEAFMFMADRAEHMAKVVKPVLDADGVVICDRFSASTISYQGYGNRLNLGMLEDMSDWAADYFVPDVTYFLNIKPEVGLERAKRVERTRFEDETLEYHRRVQQGFMTQMEQKVAPWVHVDASRSIRTVHEIVINDAVARCEEFGHLPHGWQEALMIDSTYL